MKLSELEFGKTATVKTIAEGGRVTKRLMEMGIVPGVQLRVIKSAPFGDPLEIRLLGYNLALRKNEAEAVEVE